MNCSRWHRLIALEVGGDLEPRRARSLYEHLDSCAACRELGEELRSQSRELVQSDREVLDGVTLGSVRHAVLANLADRRRPILRLPVGGRRMAFAGAAAVILVVAAVILRQGGTSPQPRVAERRMPTAVSAPTTAPISPPATGVNDGPPPAIPSPDPVESTKPEPVRFARSDLPIQGPENAISLSAPTEPMTVKILTDDPDVVIYWIVDPKGDKENA